MPEPIPTRDDILQTLATTLREVVGEPWIRELAIGADTSFSRDLELESIEFVALAEKLQGAYGRRVDFASWLAGMDLERILALTVGEVADFILKSLGAAE